MKFGVAIFPTESVQPPSEIAAMAEGRGFECLLFRSTRTSRRPGTLSLPKNDIYINPVGSPARAEANCRLTAAGHTTRSRRPPRAAAAVSGC